MAEGTSIATTDDGVRLHVESAGEGTPIVFVHEFGGDHRSWEAQMRYFSRRHRVVTYGARGYPPSEVPEAIEAYSQARATADIAAVMDHCGIDKAHIVGLSMGGFATVHFGLTYPERALSLTVAGAGYGAEKAFEDYFRGVSEEVARQFESMGAENFSKIYGMAASRIPFLVKDPRGHAEFVRMLGEHSSKGAANTMRGVQMHRPSLYDLEDALKAMDVPTLIVSGDEDDHCLQPALYMKRVIPASGLLILPKTGHTINLEEPDRFNSSVADFIAQVEAGRWLARDPRSAPSEIMKTS
ncbi:alpha/beta hydrolase [Acuticoccus sp. M5D2P5]|uniref:alpha/beta fold hydrolase n=1 Tax=Acuticoccus kalidii TaxID=2910977 RepID=UPI001F21C6E3|nr:alpha/beta hydrolase [Acuticoccus kalidii]MCF3935376.1 alpha/beta hydrolase [Acuticoccus kalidii]